MKNDKFININFSYETLDVYVIRTSIFRFIEKRLPFCKGKLLDIGCGKMPYRSFILDKSDLLEYVGLDIEDAINYDDLVQPDLLWDGITMPIESNSFDCAFGTEVLEHCPNPDLILGEVYRVLRSDGVFFGTVPFLWPLHEVPHDEYRYTPFSLLRHLENAGFTDVEIEVQGGWHSSMAQMLGLWVRRSPMSSRKRKFISYLIKPVIRKLINLDLKKNFKFKEGQMITGLSFFAKKTV